MDWISVKDKPLVDFDDYELLVDDVVFMFIPLNGGDYYICLGQVSETGGIEDEDGECLGYRAEDVSHWMPMPEPPKVED